MQWKFIANKLSQDFQVNLFDRDAVAKVKKLYFEL